MARQALHKDNIVRTAMRLFRTQGYAATGLQQIVAESGAPKGSLYHYFPGGKDSLAQAAVELAGAMVADMMQGHLEANASADEFIDAVIVTYSEWMEEGSFASGCPIATTMLECAAHSPSIRKAGHDAFKAWIDIVAAALTRDGWGEADADAEAQSFIAGLEGALILARVQQNTQPLVGLATTFKRAAMRPS